MSLGSQGEEKVELNFEDGTISRIPLGIPRVYPWILSSLRQKDSSIFLLWGIPRFERVNGGAESREKRNERRKREQGGAR